MSAAVFESRYSKQEQKMANQDPKLSSEPPFSVGLVRRLIELFRPFYLFLMMIFYGIPLAIKIQLYNPSLSIFNPCKWLKLIQEQGFTQLLSFGDKIWGPYKRPVVNQAYGKILEIGAGSGENLKYYDKDNVDIIYFLEPEPALRTELYKRIVENGFENKSKVIPCGIDDKDKLAAHGVLENIFDTVVIVQVCCSLPNARSHFKYLQSVLKSGGQLVMFEHVASTNRVTKLMQDIYTLTFWPYIAFGCELNRASGLWMRDLGGWKHVDLLRPEIESDATLLPHDIGKFVRS